MRQLPTRGSRTKKILNEKLQEQNKTIFTARKNQEGKLRLLKKELQETKQQYVDLEEQLENQERLMKELYEVKLSKMKGNLKDHVDARYQDLQKFIMGALKLSGTLVTQVTQQSQPTGLANGSVIVDKSPYHGGGL